MTKQLPPKKNIPRSITVLSVSPFAEDYVSLQTVLNHSKWELHKSESVVSALAVIRRWDISVVICERDLSPDTSGSTCWQN
jgi:hypothetical protein